MIVEFSDIIVAVLEAERGYVNHPADRGGETNLGISKTTFPDEDISSLTVSRAIELYKEHFWKPSRAEELPATIRHFYFDMVVHHGQRNAVMILQRALQRDGYELVVDGVIGPVTIGEARYAYPTGWPLSELILERVKFMNSIVSSDRSQIAFLHGWLNRAFSFEEAE